MSNAPTLTDNNPQRSLTTADKLARGLGWFSLALGAAEIVAPGRIAKALGLEGKETLLRAYGGREIAAGIGALSVESELGVWSRVPGDLLDLGTLAFGISGNDDEQQRRNAKIAIGAVAGIMLLDILVAATLSRQRSRGRGESRDYSDRSGFPGGATKARGAAGDFETPADFRADLAKISLSRSQITQH